MSWKIPRIAVLLVLCTTLVAPQTFQYSRGWTNGRKRGGMMPIVQGSLPNMGVGPLLNSRTGERVASATALLNDAGLLYPGSVGPCQHNPSLTPAMPAPAAASADSMQRYRAIIEARAPPQPSQEWKDDSMMERRRREAKEIAASPEA